MTNRHSAVTMTIDQAGSMVWRAKLRTLANEALATAVHRHLGEQ